MQIYEIEKHYMVERREKIMYSIYTQKKDERDETHFLFFQNVLNNKNAMCWNI